MNADCEGISYFSMFFCAITVMCLSIGTPKNNKFSICSKWKIYYGIFRCPKIWAHYSLIIMCLNIGTPKNHHFSFWTNGKVVVLGVPILKHFRVLQRQITFATKSLNCLHGGRRGRSLLKIECGRGCGGNFLLAELTTSEKGSYKENSRVASFMLLFFKNYFCKLHISSQVRKLTCFLAILHHVLFSIFCWLCT